MLHTKQTSSQKILHPRAAFTLVELIVVIAILVVLSTVGFVGYSGYTSTSRDASRGSDLKNIYQALKVSEANNGTVPEPDSAITIYSATGVTLSKQGVIGESVRKTINLESGGRDPKESTGYTYLRFKDKKSVQLLALFENEGWEARLAMKDIPGVGIPNVYAADYTDRYPVTLGKKIGMLLDSVNTPLNEITSYTASGVNLWLSSMATNSGILVIGNTESNATEILSDTGVLARVLSPSSLVVASSGGASSLLNCDAVSNTTGADGDLAECLDTRTHTHPAEAIAANGGNADFFDRKYDIIKMNGKWWMNEPLKYPRSSDYHIPPAWGGGLSWGCPGTVSSWNQPGAGDCWEVNALGYLYATANPDSICPTGWSLPTTPQILALNNQTSNTTSSYITGNLFFRTSIGVGSNYAFNGYWIGNDSVSYYLGGWGTIWSANFSANDIPNYGPNGSFKWYSGFPAAYSYTTRCIKN